MHNPSTKNFQPNSYEKQLVNKKKNIENIILNRLNKSAYSFPTA